MLALLERYAHEPTMSIGNLESFAIYAAIRDSTVSRHKGASAKDLHRLTNDGVPPTDHSRLALQYCSTKDHVGLCATRYHCEPSSRFRRPERFGAEAIGLTGRVFRPGTSSQRAARVVTCRFPEI